MDSVTSMIEQLSSKPLSDISIVLLVKALNLLQVKWHTDITDKTRLSLHIIFIKLLLPLIL